ncbi:hypothetical protein PR002_g10333 [Phytophthora rubi]|uniref:Uncharacterized protein n=1 Tax=Phytophthora rubi TaxID=129364 RepID=A0A6A3M9B5_9STRA|nr:hypothetical protein PR002_g10333 [Phytophthora rubi]
MLNDTAVAITVGSGSRRHKHSRGVHDSSRHRYHRRGNCIFGSTFTALAFGSWSASSSAGSSSRSAAPVSKKLSPENVTYTLVKFCDSDDRSVARAITYQRNRSSAETLCYVELPATHNIVIARARGYGNRHQLFKAKLNASSTTSFIRTSNQFLSLTDQLSLGVRLMKLDVHYFASSLRSAHCSELGIAFVDDAAAALLSALGSVLYTSGKDCKTRSHSTISLTRYRCPQGGGIQAGVGRSFKHVPYGESVVFINESARKMSIVRSD